MNLTQNRTAEILDNEWAELRAPQIFTPPNPITYLAHPLVVRARDSVHQDFSDKTRKAPKGSALTLLPFVVHLEDVATILADHGYGPNVIAAGYLHDNIEDRPKLWNKERIVAEFNPYVAELVDWVTQQNKQGTWEDRNRAYAIRLRQAPDEAVALSIADKLSNIRASTRFMQMGFPVEAVLKYGWAENSAKFHVLDRLYRERLPGALYNEFRQALALFDKLGPLVTPVQ